jgi:hypothetical protein
MVLHGLKRIFQKPTPDLSSSERTNQLRSKTVYSGTVNLSTWLAKPGSNRYKTYNGPFEVVNENGNGSLVASASYSDLLDITKGKVLLNKLPLNDLTYPYYEKNFGNGEIYVGNYQEFNGSFFSGSGPTGCADSVLVYDMSTTGFTGPGSYTENSIGNTGVSGTFNSNQDIFVDPNHCYYSDPCASSASYMKFVDINFKGPTGATGATGITGPSQYYAQKIINGNQYSGFRFPMSNFTLMCTQSQQNLSQTDGPLFCPSVFVPVPPGPVPNSLTPSNEFILGVNYYIHSTGEYTVYRFFPTTTTTGTVTPNAPFDVDYLIVGGGGAGGTHASQFEGAEGGGGGAGGLLAGTGLPLTAISYPLQVGGGGVISGNPPNNDYATSGDNSQFHTFIAVGGGHGGNKATNGGNGGSGGGAASTYQDGSGTQLNGGASTIGQGFPGGNNPIPRGTLNYSSAGGGGAGGSGYDNNNNYGSGGVGLTNTIFTGSPIYYAGGGGGSFLQGSTSNNSGNGGGGIGARYTTPGGVVVVPATNGVNGLGGGGGGGSGLGGSGVVILRFLTYPL